MEYIGMAAVALIVGSCLLLLCLLGVSCFAAFKGRDVSIRTHDAAQTLEVVSIHTIRKCYGCCRCNPCSVDDSVVCFGNGIYLSDKPAWWHFGWEVVDGKIRKKVDCAKAP